MFTSFKNVANIVGEHRALRLGVARLFSSLLVFDEQLHNSGKQQDFCIGILARLLRKAIRLRRALLALRAPA